MSPRVDDMRNRSASGIEPRGNRDGYGRVGPGDCRLGMSRAISGVMWSGLPVDRDRPRPEGAGAPGPRARPGRALRGIAVAFLVAVGESSHGDLLVGWSCNAADTSAGSLLADVGSGRLEFESIADHHDLFAGTRMNAWGDADAGDALGFRGPGAEAGSFFLEWDSTPGIGGGPGPLQCSFAMRRSDTGSEFVAVDARSGGDWIPIASIATTTGWSTVVLGLDDVLSTSATLRLRFTLSGASNPQGTVRFDNLRIDGGVVPAPGVLATMGLLVPRCRHRRRR